MNAAEILALYDREQRIEIEYPGTIKHTTPHVVRFTRPAPGMNFIQYHRLDGADIDAVIAEQVAYFSPLDQPFTWKVFAHDGPPALAGRLVAAGFAPDGDPGVVMVLDLAAPPADLPPAAPPGVEIRRITRREQLGDVIAIMEEVWGGDFAWITQRLGDHLEIPGYLSVYAAYVDGAPACASWIYFSPGSQFASLWGGSTIERFRRRGLYTALLARRVREATERGYRFLLIDASAMSQPIVAGHGFRELTVQVDYEWQGKAKG
ncbi:MAG TPA: GNAT family N-acetyltransferase [Herpetosiphonaceae bacterium]|nr:GNAT family N-acetyltransferase [Herpetosiphonaceae bacterium]